MKKVCTAIVTVLFCAYGAFSQSVAINEDGSAPDPNAILDIKSSTKGLLIPRLSTSARNALPNMPGLLIYDTQLGQMFTNNGSAWIQIATGGPVNFWTANGTHIYNNNTGFVGIGTSTPNSGFEVRGSGQWAQQRITDATSGNSLVLQAGSGGNLKISGYHYPTGTAQPLYLSVDGANTYINPNGGFVSIGSNSLPIGKLTVYSNEYGIEQTDGTRRISTYINSSGGWIGTVSNHPLNFFTNDGLPQMTITQGGGVGINTTNPTPGYYLDVNGYVKSFANQSVGFVAHTTGSTNAWARYYLRTGNSPNFTQSWFIGTSKDFIGNQFYIGDETFNQSRFTIQPNNGLIWMSTAIGVGINTANTAGYMLAVNGKVRSTEVVVETGWADYVFEKTYQLPKLEDLEVFIAKNKHLPNIPPAKEIEEKGLKVGDMQKRMMEKIEELTLYIIGLKKEIETLKTK